MLLIVEIVLTVIAWRRGWGARALLPLVVALVTGAAFAVLTGGAAGTVALLVLCDLAAIVALAGMAVAGSRPDPSTVGSTGRLDYRSPVVPHALSRYGAFENPAPRG